MTDAVVPFRVEVDPARLYWESFRQVQRIFRSSAGVEGPSWSAIAGSGRAGPGAAGTVDASAAAPLRAP